MALSLPRGHSGACPASQQSSSSISAFIEHLLHMEHEWALWQEGELISLSVCGHLDLQAREKPILSLKLKICGWGRGVLPKFIALGFYPHFVVRSSQTLM